MIHNCRVCEACLQEKDIKFVRSKGGHIYFQVNCPDHKLPYYCNEKGDVVREDKVWNT